MVRALRADMFVRLYVLQSETQDWTGVDGYHFDCCDFQKTFDDKKKDYSITLYFWFCRKEHSLIFFVAIP